MQGSRLNWIRKEVFIEFLVNLKLVMYSPSEFVGVLSDRDPGLLRFDRISV